MDENELELGVEVGVPFAGKLSLRYKRRWALRANQFLDRMAVEAGTSPAEIESRMEADERLDDLVMEGVEKAARVSDPAYREALARAVSAAFTDDAKVDEVEQMVGQLLLLDAFALRVLRGCYTGGMSGLWASNVGVQINQWRVATDLDADTAAVDGALARLASMGLVTQAATLAPAPPESLGPRQRISSPWHTTSWGARAMELCYQHTEAP